MVSTLNRGSSFSSSTASSLAKRHAPASSDNNVAKVPPHLAKKRPPLTNLTNHIAPRSSSTMVPCATKVAKTKKEPTTTTTTTTSSAISCYKLPSLQNVKSTAAVSSNPQSLLAERLDANSTLSGNIVELHLEEEDVNSSAAEEARPTQASAPSLPPGLSPEVADYLVDRISARVTQELDRKMAQMFSYFHRISPDFPPPSP